MTNAYAEWYLDDAMKNLGEAFDYAVNACGLDIDLFCEMFVQSGLSNEFGKGNPKYVSGLSGTELVMETVSLIQPDFIFPEPQIEYDCSEDYWCGWVTAYYQWSTGKSFKEIFSVVPASKIRAMYYPLHEASEEKFVDMLNAVIQRNC